MDRIRNERIGGTTKGVEISKKVQESMLNWYGHVLRRVEDYVGKRLMVMEVPGKRERGGPKRRWLDNVRNDFSERSVRGGSTRLSSMDVSRKKNRQKNGRGCGRRRKY